MDTTLDEEKGAQKLPVHLGMVSEIMCKISYCCVIRSELQRPLMYQKWIGMDRKTRLFSFSLCECVYVCVCLLRIAIFPPIKSP